VLLATRPRTGIVCSFIAGSPPLGSLSYIAYEAERFRMRSEAVNRRTAKRGWLLLGLVLALPAAAQVGHPAKGSWSGYWGPSEAQKKRILLLLDWRDNEIVGTINPGPNAIPIDKAELDVSTWTLTLEARMPTGEGRTERYVTKGKLENLGSWTNRRYSGTYELGSEHGTFIVALN
jgi:hypothetical protein